MISKLKQFMKQHPAFMDAVAVVYNLVHRNNTWKYRNVVSCKGAFLNNVKFHIIGHNNQIIIGKKARLNCCKITVLGNNCSIILGGAAQLYQILQFGVKMTIVASI